jgi:outer membrane protein OmpA-like peptidoglycan-associated protein
MNTTTSVPSYSRAAAIAVAALALAAAGCESMSEREKGTAKGAGIGAAAGAVLGGVTGNSAGKGAVIGGAVGAVAGNLWSKRMEDKRRALAEASAGTGIEVARTTDNKLKLNVPSDFSFDVGRADIKPPMRPVLDEIARNLDPKVHVAVVGHTDSSGSDAINNPLSLDRAEAVRQYLAMHGVNSPATPAMPAGPRTDASRSTSSNRPERTEEGQTGRRA